MTFKKVFNNVTGKYMPLVVILCLVVGIVFDKGLGTLTFLVPFVFAFMTFTGAIRTNFRQMGEIVRHPIPLLVSYVVIHAVIPLIAFAMGKIFLGGYDDYIAGAVLEYVVPTAVSSVMWAAVAGGDMSLTLSIILLDTLTAPFVVPFSLHLLLGADVKINFLSMILDLTWMITLPALLAMLMNQFSHNRLGERLAPVTAPLGKIALIFIITVNSTRIAPFVRNIDITQLKVIAIIFAVAVASYAIGWLVGFLLKKGHSATASIVFGCGMRNISAGAVIAAAYFPTAAMLPVMAGTLFQQATASVFSNLLQRSQKKSINNRRERS